MLETIAKGLLIGLLVSSPMGPVNMLTIQRTLNRGRKHGFATGLGAMLSDMTYSVVTLVGLSFVSGFVAEYEHTIQAVGSIILFFFGFGVFRTNPLKNSTSDRLPQETRYLRDFVSAFLLTFSNAAIVLVFVGLYARFSFNPLADGTSFFAAGLASIAAAALAWWFFLTAFVSRLRGRFYRKGLRLLNRGVGAILMLLGIGGIFLSLFPGAL
jgi:threonine/homoserine/homoserine lactone efflux protein